MTSSAGDSLTSRARGSAATRRRECLLRWLAEERRLDVVDAAIRLGVAQETVRRDLRVLESHSRLVRVHGGAVELEIDRFPTPTTAGLGPGALVSSARATTSSDRELLEAFWQELPHRGTLLLGTGRLALELAEVIATPTGPERPTHVNGHDPEALTVVTNSLDVGLTLARAPWLSVYNIGGTVSRSTLAQEGDWALTELQRMHTDVSIVCPAGISVSSGLSQATPAAAAVSQAEVAAGEKVIALVEQGALGRPSFVTFGSVSDLDEVLVGGTPNEDVAAALAERGVRCRYRRSSPARPEP